MSAGWPDEREIQSQLARLAGLPLARNPPFVVEWSGTAFRFAALQYADRDHFTDGMGAKISGGRFTPKRGPRTVYLSLDRMTATAELDSWHEYYGVPADAFRPRVLAGVAVCMGQLLNLCDPRAIEAIGLTRDLILEEWRPASDSDSVARVQAFGTDVSEAGFEGIMFPSARHGEGVNLALFPDNYRSDSHAIILDPKS